MSSSLLPSFLTDMNIHSKRLSSVAMEGILPPNSAGRTRKCSSWTPSGEDFARLGDQKLSFRPDLFTSWSKVSEGSS